MDSSFVHEKPRVCLSTRYENVERSTSWQNVHLPASYTMPALRLGHIPAFLEVCRSIVEMYIHYSSTCCFNHNWWGWKRESFFSLFNFWFLKELRNTSWVLNLIFVGPALCHTRPYSRPEDRWRGQKHRQLHKLCHLPTRDTLGIPNHRCGTFLAGSVFHNSF